MSNEFFPELRTPYIYAYSDSRFPNCLKIGYTTSNVQKRVAEQFPVKLPSQSHKIELAELAIRQDGSFFRDHDVHRLLEKKGFEFE